jgi:hypothetical protein
LAKAGKDPQAAASLLSSPEMAAAFDEWLTLSTPFLLEYFEGVDKADLRMHEFAYLGELLGVTGTDRDEAARRKLVQLYAARVKKPVESVDPEVALKEERWRLISEVYAEMARLDAKGIPFPNSEILIDGMTPAFSRIYEGSDGSGDVLRAAFADAAASLSDIDDAVGAAQAGLDSALRDVASDVSASVDDIDDTVESLRVGAIPVRREFFDGVDDSYVPDPVTRDDIARQLGFADAGELDAATADDPVMARNASILEELATYGFDLAGMDGLSADEMKAKYDAIMQWGPNAYDPYRHRSKPVDTAQIADMLDSMLKAARESLEFWKNQTPKSEFGKFENDRRIAELEATIEALESVSPEEAKQLLIDFMRDIFDDPDTTIAVNADGKLERIEDAGAYLNALAAEERGLLGPGDGRWKTGGARVRVESEAALMGLHTDVPGHLRPVYGYIVSGAARREARRKALEGKGAVIKYDADGTAKGLELGGIKEEYRDDVLEVARETLGELYPGVTSSGDLPDEEAMQIVADAVNAKIIEKYGPKVFAYDVVKNELEQLRGDNWGKDMMLLDPKVMLRSSFTEGDTINGAGRPVGYRPTMTDQQLLNLAGRAESNPNGSNRGEKLLAMAIRGHDSRFLSDSRMGKDLAKEEKIQQYGHDYIEAQIFGNFVTDEIIASIDDREGSRARHAREVLTDLTPESEVAAIKAQRAAERAGQSIDAVAADAAATIDDLDDAGDEVASFMARSFVDVVPESTDIPGGGVFETDDGGFWVPGPPPVGSTEEGKARWERGVELLRERPELFKTQVIGDDFLPVLLDEEPGIADYGVLSDLPNDDVSAIQVLSSAISRAWRAEVTEAIALRRIDRPRGADRFDPRPYLEFRKASPRDGVFDMWSKASEIEPILSEIRDLKAGGAVRDTARGQAAAFIVAKMQENNPLAGEKYPFYRGTRLSRIPSPGEEITMEVRSWGGSVDDANSFISRNTQTEGLPVLLEVLPEDRKQFMVMDVTRWRWDENKLAEVVGGGKFRVVGSRKFGSTDTTVIQVVQEEGAIPADVLPVEGELVQAVERYGRYARPERGTWKDLPDGLLHVTTGLSGLQDEGFKTRAQLRDESGEAPAGLGGGVSDAISFTTDPLVADSIVRGIHEMREAVRDDTGPAAVERMKSEIAIWDTSMPENVREKLLSAAPATMEERGEFYKDYSYWRQYNVPNRPDPLFWNPNYQAYADLDPNEVGVVTVNPSRAGTRGWQVEGMGEWRTIPEAVDIVQSEARPTVVDDMTATLDELDTVRSSAPDFGLPPGPDKLTGWDKDRLTGSSVPDIHEGKPRPVADVVDGVHLREDQKALKTVVAELSTEDDLLPLQKKLEEAFELGGSLSGKQRTDATYEIFAAINDLITSRQRDTTGFTPSQMREYEKEVAENEEWVGSRIAKAIQIHWGEARSEVFHWDFLSERVKTVLGEEFDIDVSHEPSEIDAGIEEIFEIQELLTPFIDAWVRGQYSTTQKYLEDAGITELSVFRGTYIPNVVGDDDGLPSGREPSVTRGLESWSTDIGIALGFAGNKFGTADDRIEEMAEAGELGEPTHVLQHDVVPAQLIMGIGYLDNPRIITGSLGQGEESEIVVLGSSRPVNWLSNDLLKPWRSERPEGGYDFKIKEAAVFAYLSTGLWPKFS